MALQKSVEENKKMIAKSDSEINHQMAEYRTRKEKLDKANEECMNQREIEDNINGRLLTESPDTGFQKITGKKKRVRVDLFKGMTTEQKRDILQTQASQRQEALV
ncbi:hypothetical protein HK096_010023 [Nowakowskiella sp. JEL0078]|nr:hypothetical protein HK096_010023 [Nowakowskiella sp. JEL0078]